MNWLKTLRGKFGFESRKQAPIATRRQQPSFKPGLENLEVRELMAASLTASLFGDGRLYVEGTEAADTITVRRDTAGQVSVSGININYNGVVTAQVNGSLVKRIEVNDLGGDDALRLDWGTQAQLPALIRGTGNDTLVTTAGNVTKTQEIAGSTFALAPNGTAFSLKGTDLLANGQVVCAGVKDFALANDGTLHALKTTGDLLKSTQGGLAGSFTTTNTNVSRIALRGGTDLHYLKGTDLYRSNSSVPSWTNTRDFAIDAGGTLYWLGTGGLLQKQIPGGWLNLAKGVQSFQVGASSVNSVTFTNPSDILTYAITSNGDLLVVKASGEARLNDQLAYTGSQKVVGLIPVEGGFLTRFSGGGLYFDTNPAKLGGGGVGSLNLGSNVVQYQRAADGDWLTLDQSGTLRLNGVVDGTSVLGIHEGRDPAGTIVQFKRQTVGGIDRLFQRDGRSWVDLGAAEAMALDAAGSLFFTAGGQLFHATGVPSTSQGAVRLDLVHGVLKDGILRIWGTDAADSIQVDQVGNQVVVAGVPIVADGKLVISVAVSQVAHIEVNALGGDDFVRINPVVKSQPAGVPTTKQATVTTSGRYVSSYLNGGAGNDLLLGGPGDDVIHGGTGIDHIDGGLGADSLYGDEGLDLLYDKDTNLTARADGSTPTWEQALGEWLYAGFADGKVYATTDIYVDNDGIKHASMFDATLVYSGSQQIQALMPLTGGGLLTWFSGGSIYYSPDGKNLGGGGATVLAYAGSQRVLEVSAVAGGVLTRFDGGGLYFDNNPAKLGNGLLGVNVVFVHRMSSGDWLVLQADGKALLNGQSVYPGSEKIAEIIPVAGGVLTRFQVGSVYFSPDGKNLGGGGNTLLLGVHMVKYQQASNSDWYVLEADGELRVNGQLGWSNIQDFFIDAQNRLCQLTSEGIVCRSGVNFDYGNWQPLDSDAVKWQVGADGKVYSLGRDGWLNREGTPTWSNIKDFFIDAQNRLCQLTSEGIVCRSGVNFDFGNWQPLDSDAVKWQVGADGKVYSLGRDGWLNREGTPTWSNIQDFTFDAQGRLYELTGDGILCRSEASSGYGSWEQLGTGVATFRVNPDGSLNIVQQVAIVDGALRITGSNRGDIIRVWQFGDSVGVGVNGIMMMETRASSLKQIVVDGRGGDDDIRLNAGGDDFFHGQVSISGVIIGGGGNDFLVGGGADDYIEAGAGSSTLIGSDGNDILVAGLTGNDRLDPSYDCNKGDDTYVVPGSGWVQAVHEYRLVHRSNGSVVQVREDNRGEDKLFFNITVDAYNSRFNNPRYYEQGQSDRLDDDGFWADVGKFAEKALPAVAGAIASFATGGILAPVVGAIVTQTINTVGYGQSFNWLSIATSFAGSVLSGVNVFGDKFSVFGSEVLGTAVNNSLNAGLNNLAEELIGVAAGQSFDLGRVFAGTFTGFVSSVIPGAIQSIDGFAKVLGSEVLAKTLQDASSSLLVAAANNLVLGSSINWVSILGTTVSPAANYLGQLGGAAVGSWLESQVAGQMLQDGLARSLTVATTALASGGKFDVLGVLEATGKPLMKEFGEVFKDWVTAKPEDSFDYSKYSLTEDIGSGDGKYRLTGDIGGGDDEYSLDDYYDDPDNWDWYSNGVAGVDPAMISLEESERRFENSLANNGSGIEASQARLDFDKLQKEKIKLLRDMVIDLAGLPPGVGEAAGYALDVQGMKDLDQALEALEQGPGPRTLREFVNMTPVLGPFLRAYEIHDKSLYLQTFGTLNGYTPLVDQIDAAVNLQFPRPYQDSLLMETNYWNTYWEERAGPSSTPHTPNTPLP